MRFIVRPRHALPKLDLDEPYVVVSITDPPSWGDGPARIPQRWGLTDVLRLEFQDLDPESDGEIDDAARALCMTDAHADAVAAFMAQHASIPIVVVHCTAGASRSPSTAMALCDHYRLPRTAIDWRPEHVNGHPPNVWVYDKVREGMKRATAGHP